MTKTVHPINIKVANHLLYVSQLMKQADEVHYKIQPFIRNAKAVKDCEYEMHKVSDHYLLSWKGLGKAVLREIREFLDNGSQTTKVQKYFHLKDPSYRPHQEAHNIATSLKDILVEDFAGHYLVDICGSIRRNAPFCRDIDIITTAPAELIYDIFEDCEFAVKYGGDKRIRFEAYGFGVDVRCICPEKYQFMLLHYTGSASHNIFLRKEAIKKGWTLSENGLYRTVDKEDVLPSPNTEKAIFNMLGVDYVAPEFR
ncbi:hypothetical protein NVP2275O_117 [Vibrio phage 2.275.O._10N.286.54.E11]|nr:hypothetical protein NVP2275O_117 [Vibrio phage 2.275.O._10N.286.54.E11]